MSEDFRTMSDDFFILPDILFYVKKPMSNDFENQIFLILSPACNYANN